MARSQSDTNSFVVLLLSMDSSHWMLNHLHFTRSRSSLSVKLTDIADLRHAIVLMLMILGAMLSRAVCPWWDHQRQSGRRLLMLAIRA